MARLGRAGSVRKPGMDVVDVADDDAGRPGEFILAQILEEPGLLQSAMNIGHAGFDKLAELELMAALGDFDGAQLARPIVNVLEQIAVDILEMGQVEPARRNALRRALRHELALDVIEFGGVRYSKLVPENRGAWIDVRVAVDHSAAKGRTFARM